MTKKAELRCVIADLTNQIKERDAELLWIRKIFHKDLVNPNMVALRNADGAEIRLWMDRVDNLFEVVK